jgi:hypothetical protein
MEGLSQELAVSASAALCGATAAALRHADGSRNLPSPNVNNAMTTAEAYLSDVVIVADDQASSRLPELAGQLSAEGVEIREIRSELGVIEGTVANGLVRQIDEFPGVRYVRTVFSYFADYPEGHPLSQS